MFVSVPGMRITWTNPANAGAVHLPLAKISCVWFFATQQACAEGGTGGSSLIGGSSDSRSAIPFLTFNRRIGKVRLGTLLKC